MKRLVFWALMGAAVACGAGLQAQTVAAVGPAIPAIAVEGLEDETQSETRVYPSVAGASDLRIAVNLPSFELLLCRGNAIQETYRIGIAQKNFPILPGNWRAWEVTWNPAWIPPKSDWVYKRRDVRPGEYIGPTDRRNPLGKIKIPLGKGYLIHQAAKTSDIGNLVSHGCIRMKYEDLADLAQKIVHTCAPAVSQDQIAYAAESTETFTATLKTGVPVIVTYETIVVDRGLLRIYPDVYGWGTNTAENLRQKLEQAGMNPQSVSWAQLEDILNRTKRQHVFVMALEDVANGISPVAGWHEPLTEQRAANRARVASVAQADEDEQAAPPRARRTKF